MKRMVFSRHKCHLVKLRMCYHAKMACIGEVRATIVSQINSSFLAESRFGRWQNYDSTEYRALLAVVIFTGKQLDNFQLHGFDIIGFTALFLTTTPTPSLLKASFKREYEPLRSPLNGGGGGGGEEEGITNKNDRGVLRT